MYYFTIELQLQSSQSVNAPNTRADFTAMTQPLVLLQCSG